MKFFLLILTVFCSASSIANCQVMSSEKVALLHRCFPKTEDRDLLSILNDPSLILYSDTEMPSAFQANQGSLRGVFSSFQPIAAEYDPIAVKLGLNAHVGNLNLDPGWRKPAGTESINSVRTFKFMLLPKKSDGGRWSVVCWQAILPSDSGPVWQWTFPESTIFGEVLCHRSPTGLDYTFEIRTREKYKLYWEVQVYRPFANQEELDKAILARGKKPQTANKLVKWSVDFDQPLRKVFNRTAGVAFLPSLNDDELVSDLLLNTPFKNVHGQAFASDGTLVAHAASTKADWHVVPKDYMGCMIEVSSQSCTSCHENTSLHSEDMAKNGAEKSGYPFRAWYGRSRGCDGIMSFHPFSLDSISRNGSNRPTQLRKELIQSKTIAIFDAKLHPPEVYRRLSGFDAITRSNPPKSIRGTIGR